MSNVPKLRFKEFSGKWEKKQLKEITDYVDYRGRAPIKTEKGHFLVTAKNIKKGFIDYECSKEYVSENNYLNVMSKGLPEIGDILFTTEAPMGNVAQVDNKNIALAQRVIKFRAKQMLSNSYLLHYMLSDTYQSQIIKKAIGTTVQGISGKELHNTKIFFPTKQEQKKIASFLTSIDTKIEQLTKKEGLLQQYKKGVMQKIFNQEIRFRADDGSEFCEWEEKKLEDFLNLTLREVPKPNENYLAIGIRSHCKGTFQKPDSEPKKIAMDKLYVVKENDLIVNITFAWESAIAIVKKEDEGGLVSHRFPTYTFNKNLAIVEFFRYVIIQKKFRLMLDLISPGGAGRNRVMSKKDFLKLKWKLPCVQEQTKIANFLSTIDTKIQQTQKQLTQSKEFKKALLQQMFV